MKTFILSLALLLTTALFAHAQKSDYVITPQGDTLKCTINAPMIGALSYKVDGAKPVKINTENVCEYYRAEKNKRYRAVYQEEKSKSGFLNVIENGVISLYEFVDTRYTGSAVSTVTNWFVGKNANRVTLLKTTGLIIAGKSRNERKDELAEMFKDKQEIYEAYIAEDKFSFKQIQNLVHWYNTGEKI